MFYLYIFLLRADDQCDPASLEEPERSARSRAPPPSKAPPAPGPPSPAPHGPWAHPGSIPPKTRKSKRLPTNTLECSVLWRCKHNYTHGLTLQTKRHTTHTGRHTHTHTHTHRQTHVANIVADTFCTCTHTNTHTHTQRKTHV